jgi:hypothetical protein
MAAEWGQIEGGRMLSRMLLLVQFSLRSESCSMPLDHFVSQVYLKHFYAPELPQQMYGFKKSDLKAFRCAARDVCRIEAGSNNAYFTRERLIEDFLREIEPRFNASVANVQNRAIDRECIQTIAGFAAFTVLCSPTAMRIGQTPLRETTEATAILLDRAGEVPRAPDALGNKSITELLSDREISFKIDPKFPQALGIQTIIHTTSIFGNSCWEILINDHADAPFFASDFPIAVEDAGRGIVNRVLPINPTIAIRIKPDVSLSRSVPDLRFPKFRKQFRKITRHEAVAVNRLLVRCAETMIFSCHNSPWIPDFIARNQNFRVDLVPTRLPAAKGFLLVSQTKVVPVDTK